MPLRCVNFILRVSSAAVSGSVAFTGNKRVTLQPAGGSFTAAFTYKIGDPAANAFNAEIDDDAASVSVSPSAPVTRRQRMGATSPSDTVPVDPNEVQTGSVSGSVPVNTSTDEVEHTVTLTMTQPD